MSVIAPSIEIPDFADELLELIDGDGCPITVRLYGTRLWNPTVLYDVTTMLVPKPIRGRTSRATLKWDKLIWAVWHGIEYDLPIIGRERVRVPFDDGHLWTSKGDIIVINLSITFTWKASSDNKEESR